MRADALVELIDLAPTLLELAGVEAPRRMQGRSLLPILKGAVDPHEHREAVRCDSTLRLSRSRRWAEEAGAV